MSADGYKTVDVTPWETGFEQQSRVCDRPGGVQSHHKTRAAGWNLFYLLCGISTCGRAQRNTSCCSTASPWRIGRQMRSCPPAAVDAHLDGNTSTLFTVPEVRLKAKDVLTLRGTPNQGEPAPVDYIEVDSR